METALGMSVYPRYMSAAVRNELLSQFNTLSITYSNISVGVGVGAGAGALIVAQLHVKFKICTQAG